MKTSPQAEWYEKRRRVLAIYPKFPNEVIAFAVGLPIDKVRQIAKRNHLEKDSEALAMFRKHDPDERRDAILDEYPQVPAYKLAKKYGMKTADIHLLAESYGVKRENQPNIETEEEKKIWECIYADYPDYPTKELEAKYGIPSAIIYGRAHDRGLRKNKERTRAMIRKTVESYPTKPTREIASDLGVQEDTVRKRANRLGLHKQTPWKNTRKPKEPTFQHRMVLAFAATSTVESIADKVGLTAGYVRVLIKRAGLTPITEPKPVRSIIQWTLDGQIVNRYPSCGAAARAIGGSCSSSNIWACTKGKVGNKTAYGFRWTEEIINP